MSEIVEENEIYESSYLVNLDTVKYESPGQNKMFQVLPYGTPATSLPTGSVTKFSFILPSSLKNLSRSKYGVKLVADAANGNNLYHNIHTGFLSCWSIVKLYQQQNGAILYSQNNVNYLSKLRNRAKYAYNEAKNRSTLLPLYGANAAAFTDAALGTWSSKGGFLQVACQSSVAVSPVGNISTPSYALPDTAGAVTVCPAVSAPVQNVALVFTSTGGTSPGGAAAGVGTNTFIGMRLEIPLKDLGGVFEVDKYLPYMADLTLEITWLPVSYWTYDTTAWTQAGNAASSYNLTVSNSCIWVDTASDALTRMSVALLGTKNVVVNTNFITETTGTLPANVSPVQLDVRITGSQGSRLRYIYSGVFSTSVTNQSALNMDNRGGVKYDSLMSYFNNKQLQDNAVTYDNMYDYQETILQGGLYANNQDFMANPVWIEDFVGDGIHNPETVTKDCGLNISGTVNNYAIRWFRTTGVATARTAFAYVETQLKLILTSSGAQFEIPL